MFDRPKTGELALLVHVCQRREDLAEQAAEFELLAGAAGATVLFSATVVRRHTEPKYYLGSGVAEEVAAAVKDCCAEVVIVDAPLSPSQERNLERLWQCRVLDRSGLILDIFAQRARSFEGKLQVELAQLRHLSTRLVRGWTHLERQKGGIGLRGPGETQLETDRRLLADRIKSLSAKLDKILIQREQHRSRRDKAELATLALVGYTNAGKSTLFNALVNAKVYQADQLFATLDPTVRRLDLDGGQTVVLADTVGFVRDLPHELIAAFRATLEETREASLLLHVIDAADPQLQERVHDVRETLAAVGAEETPVLRVYNKIDQLPGQEPMLERDADGKPAAVWLSAGAKQGLALLHEAIAEHFGGAFLHGWFCLQPQWQRAAEFRARLYRDVTVLEEQTQDDGSLWLLLEIPPTQREQLAAEFEIELKLQQAPELDSPAIQVESQC